MRRMYHNWLILVSYGFQSGLYSYLSLAIWRPHEDHIISFADLVRKWMVWVCASIVLAQGPT